MPRPTVRSSATKPIADHPWSSPDCNRTGSKRFVYPGDGIEIVISGEENMEAYANAIAAIPSLLAAAKYARDNVAVGSSPTERNAWQRLDVALTLAEGRLR